MAWLGGAPDWAEFARNPEAYQRWLLQQSNAETAVDASSGRLIKDIMNERNSFLQASNVDPNTTGGVTLNANGQAQAYTAPAPAAAPPGAGNNVTMAPGNYTYTDPTNKFLLGLSSLRLADARKSGGWGSLAQTLINNYEAVTGTTLSPIAKASLKDRAERYGNLLDLEKGIDDSTSYEREMGSWLDAGMREGGLTFDAPELRAGAGLLNRFMSANPTGNSTRNALMNDVTKQFEVTESALRSDVAPHLQRGLSRYLSDLRDSYVGASVPSGPASGRSWFDFAKSVGAWR